MDSDLRRRRHLVHDRQNPHQQLLEQQMNSGLMRYKSAPSSYFASLINGGVAGGGGEICGEFLNPRPSTPETDRIFARFMSSGGTETSSSHNLCGIGQNSSANEALESQFVASMKHETDIFRHQHDQQQQQNNGYSSASQAIYQNQSQPSLPNHNSAPSNSGIDNSYRVVGSIAVDRLPQMKMSGGGGCGNSNLIRHSSSPAGFFSHINVENGYDIMRGMGNFGAGNVTNVEASFSGRMTPISEDGSKSMGMSDPEDESFSEDHRNNRAYITGFPIGSWNDSAILSDSFPKRLEDDGKTFSSVNALDSQNAEGGNRPPTVLSHHLSLPKSSAELAAMEKLFQFQDSVPCKIRAKRGCATHPRSIAERVRRTRISERMRKLQELVPNMDKQTNTSDMLDLAVDYIKDLQKHVKILSDNRSKCTCSNKPKP